MSQQADTTCWVHDGMVLVDQVEKHYSEGVPDSHLLILQQALILLEKGDDVYELVSCLTYMAYQYYRQEDYGSMEEVLRTSLRLVEEEYRPILRDGYLASLNNLSVLYQIQGDYSKALQINASVIAEEKKGKSDLLTLATGYQNQGFFYLHSDEYTEAILHYKEALSLRQSDQLTEASRYAYENRADIFNIYVWMGRSYRLQGNIEAAKSCFHTANCLAQQFPANEEYSQQNHYASSYNLAEIYLEEGPIDSAYYYAKKALAISEQFELSDEYYGYRVLAQYYARQDQETEALSYFDRALEKAVIEAAGLEIFPPIASAFLAKAKYLNELQHHQKAIENCQKGLQAVCSNFESQEWTENPTAEQAIQKALAIQLLIAKGDAFVAWQRAKPDSVVYLKSAYQSYRLATELIQLHRRSFVSEPAKKRFAKETVQAYEKAIRTAWQLYQQTKEQSYQIDIFTLAEGNKANILYQNTTDEMAKQMAGLPDSLLQKDKDLMASRHFVEKRMTTEQDSAKYAELERALFQIKEDHKDLILEFETHYPRYYQLKYQDRIQSLMDVQARLAGTDEVVIEFFVGQQQAYSMVITEQELHVFAIEDWAAVVDQVRALLPLLYTEPVSEPFVEDYQKFSRRAYALYQALLEPALQVLPTHIASLTIVPDDLLCYLPFGSLLTAAADPAKADYRPEHLPYLIERFAIAYQYSVGFMLQTFPVRSKSSEPDMIAFAPRFSDQAVAGNRICQETSLAQLPCAQEEAEAVYSLVGGKLLLASEATLAAFRQNQHYGFIHLATHACIDENDPNNNQIYFADGYLSSTDLYQLDMNADLVVLSACNTGAGQLAKGEGVMSLSRAFIQAGCQSTLTSLWAVNDCTTAALMPDFYRGLKKEKSKSRALQAAKLTYLQAAQDPAAAHPFYWAAFVAFGDNAPIEVSSGPAYRYLAVGLVGILFLGWLWRVRWRNNVS